MPNENNNQQSNNQPQKHGERDREQQRRERIPQKSDEEIEIGRAHDEAERLERERDDAK
jgi:hypothetical protein